MKPLQRQVPGFEFKYVSFVVTLASPPPPAGRGGGYPSTGVQSLFIYPAGVVCRAQTPVAKAAAAAAALPALVATHPAFALVSAL